MTATRRSIPHVLFFVLGVIATGVYVLGWSVLNGLVSGFGTDGYVMRGAFWITCVAPIVLWIAALVIALRVPGRRGLWVATIPLLVVAVIALGTFTSGVTGVDLLAL